MVSILPCAKEYFVEHGMSAEKFLYVPNGIDTDDWDNPEELPFEHAKALKKAHEENRFILAFFGSHTRSYSLDYLLQALSKVDQSKIFVAFVGEGNYKNELIELAKKLGIDPNAYVFLPGIKKKAIPSLLKECDGSYIGAIKNRMFRFGIGMNKMFDAMMGGKPLLYAVDAPNNFAEEYSCGISVEAENVYSLVNGLNQLMELSKEEREKIGANGRNAVIRDFIYPVLAEYFLDSV